jgi:hypothetical protein
MTKGPGAPAGDDAENRNALRLRKYIDVVVEDALSAMLFRAAVADISPTGMRMIVDQYLPVGTKYTFTMKRAPFLVLRGEVRWIKPSSGDNFQVGILIAFGNDDERKRLTSFLELERQRLTAG